jgi:hypothetical protein
LLLLPVSLGWGVSAGRADLFVAGLTAEALLWIGLRFWVHGSSRRTVSDPPVNRLQSLDSGENILAFSWLAILIVLGGATFLAWRQFGWLGTWEQIKQTWGAVLITWLFSALVLELAPVVLVVLLVLFVQGIRRRLGGQDNASPLGRLAGEVVPLVWFLLFGMGPGLERLVGSFGLGHDWLSAPAVACLLAPLLAWWEGVGSFPTRARFGLAVAAAASQYEGVWAAVVAVHDGTITGPLVHSSVNLRYLLPLVVWGSLGLALFLAVIQNVIWRVPGFNRWLKEWAFWLLRRYFHLDPRGRFHAWLSHRRHCLARAGSIPRRLFAALQTLWGVLFGRLPYWLDPKPFAGPTRFEQFAQSRVGASTETTQRLASPWRAAFLRDPGAEETGRLAKELSVAAWRQAHALLALTDYCICPYSPCEPNLAFEALWELAERIDWLLLAVRYLPLEADLDLIALRGRLRAYYAWLARNGGGLAELAQERQRLLDRPRGDDLQRRQFRDRILAWVVQHGPALAGGPAAFAVHGLLAEYHAADDWQGLLEAARRLEREAGYTLTDADHLDLGEACWHHAAELGAGDRGRWVHARSLTHFYQAQADHHLAGLPSPWGEAEREGRAHGEPETSATQPVGRA